MDGGSVAGRGLVVARGDAPELLEPLKAVLDEVAPLVHLGVMRDRRFAVLLGRNDGDHAALVQAGAQGVTVERFVGDESIEIDVSDQRLDADAVMALAGKKNKVGEVSQRIDESHDLDRQPAARLADRLVLSPPFAPVPCRWTLTIVPSINAYSKSGSPDNSRKSRSNTPLRAQRRKR